MRFALIGAAGYVAPRHMKAIRDVGGELVAALDPHDSVGILDSYFPNCAFFTEFERFDRFCEKEKREGRPINYVSIVSPNYLHDSHCRFALRIGADAICEKPLVLRTRNLDALLEIEKETGKRVWCVSQLRCHPEAERARKSVNGFGSVLIDYLTPRGAWYRHSWKSNIEKSGGLTTNIGFHMFDLCSSLFGGMLSCRLQHNTPETVGGSVHLERGTVDFTLSIAQGEKRREFTINGESYRFDSGFEDLHAEVYRQVLAGNGVGINDVKEAVSICEEVRNA